MWDTPHSALPRRVIGSSTDGRGRLRRPRDSRPSPNEDPGFPFFCYVGRPLARFSGRGVGT